MDRKDKKAREKWVKQQEKDRVKLKKEREKLESAKAEQKKEDVVKQ